MFGTAHFGFIVRDLDRSIAFYQGVMGMELLGVMDRQGEDISTIVGVPNAQLRIAFLMLPKSGVKLELIQYIRPQGQPVDTSVNNPGNGHLCFAVDDIPTLYASLRDRGVRFLSAPAQVLTGMNKGAWAVYMQDPDGIKLELLQAAPKPQV